VIYISSLIRSVLALHNLINNKIALKDAENETADDKANKEKNEKVPIYRTKIAVEA